MRDHERATRRRTRSSLPTRLDSLSPAQPLPQHLYQVRLTAKTRTVLELPMCGPQPRCPNATVFAEGLMSSQLAARDAIQHANRVFRERHAQARRGHAYREGEEVLLSSEHLSLRG